MAAKRCSICGVNWPNNSKFSKCPICEEGTDYFPNATPSVDWQEKEKNADVVLPSSSDTKLTAYRLERIRALGIALDLAMLLASDRRVELGGFEKEHTALIEKGCEPTLAAHILAP